MEKELLKEIYEARWLEWRKEVIDNISTPVLLISMGHGEKIGELNLSTCEEVDDFDIRRMLVTAIRLLDKKAREG